MNKKKIIISILITILCITMLMFGFNKEEIKEVEKTIEKAIELEEVIINNSTTEIPELTETDEQTLEYQEIENEAFELQGDIAYEGDAKTWNLSTTNDIAQLTYISQVDSRWKDYLYTSIGNESQTIGSSGCGVACATMTIDGIVGDIDIRTVADVFVRNGYRSANNGTYWSAYRALADQFDIEYKETIYLDKVVDMLKNNHYVIASCGNGLFTTGGHYIFIYGIEGDMLKIYDPYLYNGKFNTSTRRGKAEVKGNTVYVSIDNFREYANYKQFFCYKYNANKTITNNDTVPVVVKKDISTVSNVNYKARITANPSLRIRSGASTSYSRIGSYSKGKIVTILAEANGFGKTEEGWISLQYISRINEEVKTAETNTIGKYITTANINVRTGAGANYKAKTYKQLTANARSQNKALGNYYYNGYKKGVVCTVTKIVGNWGYTKSGWICLNYCKRI